MSIKKSTNRYRSIITNNIIDPIRIRRIYRKKVYYSFLTIFLAICLLQSFRGVYINAHKYIDLNSKLSKLEKINIQAKRENAQLKRELKDYNSVKGIEALARDNLNMAGKNEVLVIIKDN